MLLRLPDAGESREKYVLLGMNLLEPLAELRKASPSGINFNSWTGIAVLKSLALGERVDSQQQQAAAIATVGQVLLNLGPDAVTPRHSAMDWLVRQEIVHKELLDADDDARYIAQSCQPSIPLRNLTSIFRFSRVTSA